MLDVDWSRAVDGLFREVQQAAAAIVKAWDMGAPDGALGDAMEKIRDERTMEEHARIAASAVWPWGEPKVTR